MISKMNKSSNLLSTVHLSYTEIADNRFKITTSADPSGKIDWRVAIVLCLIIIGAIWILFSSYKSR